MKISLDWLGDFVSWDDTPADLAAKLTSVGLNVEGIETFEQTFPGVVVAKVVQRQQHPDADRLSLCRVDTGTGEETQVVCGAPNVREGLTVLFATVGAVLPGNFKIKKTKIRGVESLGMICSASELQISTESDGIMELETELPVGTSADELFGFKDTVLDIEVTPNRPDWLSHLGVAREVGAIYGKKISLPRIWSPPLSGESLGLKVRIENFSDCPRYMAFGVRDVTVGPSPREMQNRLRAVGSRPINNVVDITNYVMLEMGQPMHAFDQSKLSGTTITVRRSEKGLRVVTLDQQERVLDAEELLVCDERGAVALAGVMGLANSEVADSTTELVLESAFFNPQLVRTASRGLGLISDSSYRFERGADWDMVEKAAHRALYLLQIHAGAHIIPEWADRADPDRKAAEAIPLRVWQVNRLLGTDISTEDAAHMLQNLGLKVQPMGNAGAQSANAVNMMVQVPSFRRDLALEVDLIEEIARSFGYDNMTGNGSFLGVGGAVRNNADVAVGKLRTWFSACGYHELVTSSFQAEKDLDQLGMAADDLRRQSLSVMNANHGGNTALRTSLLPSLLDVARHNINSGAPVPLRFFQINRAFWPGGRKTENPLHPEEPLLPEEPQFLQFAIVGNRQKGLDGLPADLLELKGTLAAVSSQLRVELAACGRNCEAWLETGAQWAILDSAGNQVGTAGRVTAKVLAAFDLDVPVAVGEINLSDLDLTPNIMQFKPFGRFPAVKRDLSLLVPAAVAYDQLVSAVREAGGPLLADVDLFDIYRGQGVPEGHGAYGIRLKFQSDKGNLKGKTVDRAIQMILEAVKSRLQIEPRGQD